MFINTVLIYKSMLTLRPNNCIACADILHLIMSFIKLFHANYSSSNSPTEVKFLLVLQAASCCFSLSDFHLTYAACITKYLFCELETLLDRMPMTGEVTDDMCSQVAGSKSSDLLLTDLREQ